jgi:hypothetical protein
MPRHAFWLKKYRSGMGSVSKTSDKEHTLASLGQSEVLSVKHSPGVPIPELPQRPEDSSKRPSPVIGQNAGDVLPSQPAGPKALNQRQPLKGEVAARVIQAEALSSEGKRLTGCSTDQKVDWVGVAGLDLGEVAKIRYLWIVMRQHGAGEFLDFREERGLPSERMPCDGRRFDSAAN